MDPATLALVAAVVGSLGAYLAAARRFSGKIGSSDAAELWQESRSIRDWSRDRIEVLNDNVTRLEQRVDALEGSNSALSRENRRLVHEVRDLNNTIDDLRAKVRSLSDQLKASRARIAELEASGA